MLTGDYLAARFEAGASITAIADDVGCSWDTVREHAARHALIDVDGVDLDQVRGWYEAGDTVDDVAARVDVHPRTARLYLIAAGAEMRDRGRRP